MQRPKIKDQDFIGKEAIVAQAAEVDDLLHTGGRGGQGERAGGLGVTTAGSAPSLGKHVLMAFLPPDQAVVGTQLAVSYMEELYPVTVAATDATPLFDPENLRIRGLA